MAKQPDLFLECLTLNMEALWSFKMQRTASPKTQYHIPEDLTFNHKISRVVSSIGTVWRSHFVFFTTDIKDKFLWHIYNVKSLKLLFTMVTWSNLLNIVIVSLNLAHSLGMCILFVSVCCTGNSTVTGRSPFKGLYKMSKNKIQKHATVKSWAALARINI
jgi:hypothetical protein